MGRRHYSFDVEVEDRLERDCLLNTRGLSRGFREEVETRQQRDLQLEPRRAAISDAWRGADVGR